MPARTRIFAVVAMLLSLFGGTAAMAQPRITIERDHFNVNGLPRFLIFISYFDAMRARTSGPCFSYVSDTSLQCDLKYIKDVLRFDGVRIFASFWDYRDLSDPTNPGDNWARTGTLFTADGVVRPEVLNQLKGVLDAAGAAGLIVDLTFARETNCAAAPIRASDCPASATMSVDAYRNAVSQTVTALANESARFSHVIVDLQNEHDLDRPPQHLSDADVSLIASQIRAAGGPISRRLMASTTGTAGDMAAALTAGTMDIAAWHELRDPGWYSATQARVSDLRSQVSVPVYLQEPQRWQDDRNGDHFNIAVQGAKLAGAAAWTLHTRTAFNLSGTSFLRRLDLDPAQRTALERVRAAADQVTWPVARMVAVDAPAANQTVLQPFVLNGWAIDSRAPSGTGIDTVHVWAFPADGGPAIFCGASYGVARADVAALYGSRFTNSGFSLPVRDLPQRVPYTFIAYAHSTVTGTFDNARAVENVTALNQPLLSVDAPGPTTTSPFLLAGWALDLSASSSTGVNTIHVWAYPAAGGPPRFVGVPAYGGFRPDVAAAFGPQFASSGFNLIVSDLPPGVWDLALFPYSTLNNTFFPAFVRRVTVSP